jgi:hypothetical protein
MPVTLAPGAIVLLRMNYSLDADRAFNVLHYRFVGGTVIATGLPMAIEANADACLPALGQTLDTIWEAAWPGNASVDVAFMGTTVQKIYPLPLSTPYEAPGAAPTFGTVAGDSMPLQDSVTLLKKTGVGGRQGFGRAYFVGLAEADCDKGFISGARAVGLNTLAPQLAASISCDDGTYQYLFEPVLYAPVPAGAPRVTRITACVLSDNVIKTQRRRRPGKGI